MENATADYIQMIGFPALLAIPMFLIIFAGIGFSVFNYKKSPRSGMLAIIALSILGILQLTAFIQPFLTIQLIERNIENEVFSLTVGIIAVLNSILGAVALALLIFAVWINRSPK